MAHPEATDIQCKRLLFRPLPSVLAPCLSNGYSEPGRWAGDVILGRIAGSALVTEGMRAGDIPPELVRPGTWVDWGWRGTPA